MTLKKTLAFALILIALATAAQLHAFDLDSLLVVSIGGPEAYDSLKLLTSYHAKGSVDLNGLQGRFDQYFVLPDRFYVKVSFDDFSLVQAYDGQTAWQMDHNRQVSQLQGYEKQELLKNLYFESFSYLLPEQLEGGREYLGKTIRGGQSYHEVAFYPFNTDTVLAYFDPDTGLRMLMVSRLDNFNTVTYIDKYRKVAGILIPFYSKAVAEEAGLFSEFEIDTVEPNIPIDMSIFSAPKTGAADYHFPQGARYVEIPIEYRAGHIRLPVIINGKRKALFILDSGSSANILHKPVVDELKLPVVGTLPARGLSGFEEVDLVKTDSVSIGRLTLYNQVAGSLDLSVLRRTSTDAESFGGLLGYDFLSRFPVLVAYRDSTLTVYNPDHFEPPEGGVEVPFHLTMMVPTVQGELNGIPGDFIVDLGNALGLIIHQKFARAHKLDRKLDDIRDNPETFGGVGGGLTAKTAFAATFKVGDILIQSLRVILPDSSAGLAGSQELAGNIGNLILENFNVLFDYNQSRLIFYDADR